MHGGNRQTVRGARMKRPRHKFPIYLSQSQVDLAANVFYRHQHITDVLSKDVPASAEAACLLTELRRQCCVRSGAADPFPDLPMSPAFSEGGSLGA